MPIIRYVGKHIDHTGKRLYEILFKLKNLGLGRMVYRNTFKERYPEPSYYIITKVKPDFEAGEPIVSTYRRISPQLVQVAWHWIQKVEGEFGAYAIGGWLHESDLKFVSVLFHV